MIRRPPRSTRTDTLFPYTTLFRSLDLRCTMRGVQAKAKDGSVTTTLTLEARPLIPPELSRLNDLAGNLAYAWDRDIRRVFWRLDHRLWIECENNPKLVLRRVSQAVLQQVANDRDRKSTRLN